MSWYLTIRSDAAYSRSAEAESVVDFLAAMPELRRVGPDSFQAADGQPWVAIVVAASDSAGNYSADGQLPSRVNVVEMVCSYSGDRTWYDSLAGRIADFLEWTAFEDNEGRQVWPSSGHPV